MWFPLNFFYCIHQAEAVILLHEVPRPLILISPPPLRLPYTIHYHQHIHRMKERLAGFKQSLSCYFTAIYQFILLHLSPIFNLLIYFMKKQIAKFKRSIWCNFMVLHIPRLRLSPFCNLLMYLFTSFMGFLVLKSLRIRNPQEAPRDIYRHVLPRCLSCHIVELVNC